MKSALFLLIGILTSVAFTQPAEVIVIRHAEKPEDPDALHLSARGQERAKALIHFFTKNPKATKNGLPVALYASKPTRRGRGQRPRETLEPLAQELHLPIQTPFLSEDFDKLAKEIRHNASYQGKTVVICWVHEYLPALAASLGVNPEPSKWKDKVFDRAYVITYVDGQAQLDTVSQKLLPGDNKYKE